MSHTCSRSEGDAFLAVQKFKMAYHETKGQFSLATQNLGELLDFTMVGPGKIQGAGSGIIPGEIQDDAFGAALRALAMSDFVGSILEIGSSSGAGSTAALVSGALRRTRPPSVYCLESSGVRVEKFRKRYSTHDFIKIWHANSVPLIKCLSSEQIKDYPSNEARLRTESEIQAFRRALQATSVDDVLQQRSAAQALPVFNNQGISTIQESAGTRTFDVVVLDGGDLCSEAELSMVLGSSVILLDDVMTFKNFASRQRLLESSDYQLILEDVNLRNGFSVFARNEMASTVRSSLTGQADIPQPPSPSPQPSYASPMTSPAVKGAVVYLTSDKDNDIQDLCHSLWVLDANFLFRYPYPVIIFHEGLSQAELERIRRSANVTIYFEEIILQDLPANLEKFQKELDQLPSSSPNPNDSGYRGYRFMCRFFAGEIFKHPSLAQYDYYMRLDTDSLFLEPLTFDPFRMVQDGGYNYAFLHDTFLERPAVLEGFWEALDQFLEIQQSHSSVRKFKQRLRHCILDEPGCPPILGRRAQQSKDGVLRVTMRPSYFYNNFEIGKLDFFRSSGLYQDWYNFIDQAGGILKHRWGDAPIRTYGVLMSMEPEQILDLRGKISYFHAPFLSCKGKSSGFDPEWNTFNPYGFMVNLDTACCAVDMIKDCPERIACPKALPHDFCSGCSEALHSGYIPEHLRSQAMDFGVMLRCKVGPHSAWTSGKDGYAFGMSQEAVTMVLAARGI